MSIKEGTVFQDTDTGKWLVAEKQEPENNCINKKGKCFYYESVCPREDCDLNGLVFRKIRKDEFLPTSILPPCNMHVFVKSGDDVLIHEYDESQKDIFKVLCDGWRPIGYPKVKEGNK